MLDIERLAETIRLAYAKADDSHRQHIYDNPWETLPEGRKHKWRAMAEAAAMYFTEEVSNG